MYLFCVQIILQFLSKNFVLDLFQAENLTEQSFF